MAHVVRNTIEHVSGDQPRSTGCLPRNSVNGVLNTVTRAHDIRYSSAEIRLDSTMELFDGVAGAVHSPLEPNASILSTIRTRVVCSGDLVSRNKTI